MRLPAGWVARLEAHLGRQDRRLPLLADVAEAVLGPEGRFDPAARRAAFNGEPVPGPPEVASYADTVRRHAYRVTDEDVEALHAAGLSDDDVFELTLAVAAGAGFERLYAGLAALGDLD